MEKSTKTFKDLNLESWLIKLCSKLNYRAPTGI